MAYIKMSNVNHKKVKNVINYLNMTLRLNATELTVRVREYFAAMALVGRSDAEV